MRLGKSFALFPTILPLAALGWYAYGAWLGATIPKVEIRELSPLLSQRDRALPFFEVMSPLPDLDGGAALPKLEYKKGPPDRYLERISLLLKPANHSAKERIVYHGRRTRSDLVGVRAFPEEAPREARYIEAALRLSQQENVPQLSGLSGFLYRPFLLREAKRWLENIETVSIMDQAGTPAFLFSATPGPDGRARATALFIRRSSFYRIDYLGDRGFSLLEPATLFRKTFLTTRRADAMAFLAQNLSEVKLTDADHGTSEAKANAGSLLRNFAWPILLLAANVSVDPASLDSFFHFAGINALLYKSNFSVSSDLEVSDSLRNNVLASDLYAQDIDPSAEKTAEIARLARLLTRNFDH